MNLECRCQGIDRRCPCDRLATQEDGLCDGCRCPHGCCEDHGDIPSLWDEMDGRVTHEERMAATLMVSAAIAKCEEERNATVDRGGP